MKLYIECSDCKKNISFWTWSSDRIDLKMKHGDKIKLKCKNCNSTRKYYIDNLKAKKSKVALLLALIIFVIGTPISLILLWNYVRQSGLYSALGLIFIISIPSSIYGIINKNEKLICMIGL